MNKVAIGLTIHYTNEIVEYFRPQIDKLKENLDENSKKYVEFFIDSAIRMPSRYTKDWKKMQIIGDPLSQWYYPTWLLDLYASYKAKSKLYYFGHGLDIMPAKVKDYIENKIAFDLGSFDGGSALMLSKNYNFSHIHSFDISLINLEKIKTNLKNNDNKKNIILHHLALGDKVTTFEFEDNGEQWTNIKSTPKNNKVIVNQSTLDIFMEKYKDQQIGFIKMDIEGAEMDCLKGAKESIIKHRPILALSIYHSIDQFFNIKPFVESLNCNYKFIITQLRVNSYSTGSHEICPILDTNLLAYPAELDN